MSVPSFLLSQSSTSRLEKQNFVQSTSPRSVSRSSGRQARGMSAIVIKGETMSQPISFQASERAATFSLISSALSGFISPASGSSTQPRILPSRTAHMPPPQRISVLAARAMSSSFVPTTSRLCASCATVEAIAPHLMLKPLTKPTPCLPVLW